MDELLSRYLKMDRITGAPVMIKQKMAVTSIMGEVGDRKGLAGSLEVAETIAYEASMQGVDLLADLSGFYDLMLSKHCPGKTS